MKNCQTLHLPNLKCCTKQIYFFIKYFEKLTNKRNGGFNNIVPAKRRLVSFIIMLNNQSY